MRFHILGLSHTIITKGDYSPCAFSGKIRLLCRMLHERGHEVIFYGTEGSDPACSENVVVVNADLFRTFHGKHDWKRDGFLLDPSLPTEQRFRVNAIREIGMRKQPGDFLLVTFGAQRQKPIADAHPDMIVVESGIGYADSWAEYRVWETNAWRHFCYGREDRLTDPPKHDATIPQYLDLADFPFTPVKASPPYAIHLGRVTTYKGLAVSIAACKAAGMPLYVAGQQHSESPDYTYLGVLGIEERAKWVGGATCLLAPTQYVEPGGTVTLEAAALGTPVVTTDWGSFTETVIHGETGWRCRTPEEFAWAVHHASDINPARCREVAEARWSLPKVAAMYDYHFRTLAAHVAGRAAEIDDLDWLRRDE